MDDPMCGPILDIVDRVCGSEVVSCSTVTVTKCQAALKTLQTFPFFNPTCLCREPQLDQKCNSFRTFLFDHPCLFANRREKDPYPIDSLVSCTHAHSICKNDANCSRIYDHFKHVCRTAEEDKCIPELQDPCKESWSKIRLTPMFGCICPPNLWQGQKKCDRHFNFVNHNRCAGSDLPVEMSDVLTNFQSTCSQAMRSCERNLKCATAMSGVVAHCDIGNCKRHECQRSLQSFYRDKTLAEYTVEVAFCLCKKTNNSEEDACMRAQNMLHPSCAQAVDTITPPACHTVAADCRSDPQCGPLLEEFEQLCAADNYTKTCAGYPEQCRIGMLGILGTILRTHCVCKGTDRAKLYECIGWQRVLWFNPCVVEAQRKFHMNKVRATLSRSSNSSSRSSSNSKNYVRGTPTMVATITEMYLVTTPITQSRTNRTTSIATTITAAAANTTTIITTTPTIRASTLVPTATNKPIVVSPRLVATLTTIGWTTQAKNTPVLSTSPATEPNRRIFRKHGFLNMINRGREEMSVMFTHDGHLTYTSTEGDHKITTSTKRPSLHLKSTSKRRSSLPPPLLFKTTSAPQGCILQKTSLDDEMFVAEGKATRFYHDYENDCSEMCYCIAGNLLKCQTECIQPVSCKTDAALYKHGAPAYQAFRGRCLCYSGKFICMRPKSSTYNVPPGVFLYLGYSSIDEHLLTKHVNFEIQDSVFELQELLNKKLTTEGFCYLSLFSVGEENAIVLAKFRNSSSNTVRPIDIKPSFNEITKDKESCINGLEALTKAINEQHHDIKTNVFLSIFKLGEIEITYPEVSDSSARSDVTFTLFLLSLLLFTSLNIH